MKYKLHYAKLNHEGDIPVIKFEAGHDFEFYFWPDIVEKPKIVYLLCCDDEVIVTENVYLIEELLSDSTSYIFPVNPNIPIFLQEYESYEEAYQVALDIKEVSPLCYSKEEPKINVKWNPID
jgi:hypothetical protein